jgi:hypothetical protein
MTLINKFSGFNNTDDGQKLDPGVLVTADNVYLTTKGSVKRRPGSQLLALGTKITGSYATSDNRFMFLVDNGSLVRFDGNGFEALATGLPVAPSFWCEESTNRVFVVSGGAYLQIDNGTVVTQLHTLSLPADNGIDDLGRDTSLYPTTGVVAAAYHRGSVVLGAKVSEGLTRIQFSIPGVYHLFHNVQNRFEIPDDVVSMDSVNNQLLIVCKHSVYSFSEDGRLNKLADYGSVVGKSITKLADNGCFIWTTRGVVKYPEFQNVTENELYLPPGNGCSTGLFEHNGEELLLICSDGGGIPYNAL